MEADLQEAVASNANEDDEQDGRAPIGVSMDKNHLPISGLWPRAVAGHRVPFGPAIASDPRLCLRLCRGNPQ